MIEAEKQKRLARLNAEIGTDPANWSKTCLVPYPPWVDKEIDKLIRAVKKINAGQKAEAKKILRSIRGKEMTEWYENVGQWTGAYRRNLLNSKKLKEIPKSHRASSNISLEMQMKVIKRDNYRCRYCQIRLIHKNEIITLQNKFGRKMIPICKESKNEREYAVTFRHGIINMCQATYDHVKPLQLGGRSSVGNLVATCKACNYGKGKFSLKELGLNQPRKWQIIVDEWQGLADLLNSKKS